MRLGEFYRKSFVDAIRRFEPVWLEDNQSLVGYRWSKSNYPYNEQFQIAIAHHEVPVLMYSMILSEVYLQTTIYDVIKRYSSTYDLSLIILDKRLWLNVSLSSDKLQDSIMGFINNARSHLMNVLDCIIDLPDEAYNPFEVNLLVSKGCKC